MAVKERKYHIQTLRHAPQWLIHKLILAHQETHPIFLKFLY